MQSKDWVFGTFRIASRDLAKIAVHLKEKGVVINSRNDLVATAIATLASLIKGKEVSSEQASDYLDRTFPVQSWKGGVRVRNEAKLRASASGLSLEAKPDYASYVATMKALGQAQILSEEEWKKLS